MRVVRVGRAVTATLLAVMLLGGTASGLVISLPAIDFAVTGVSYNGATNSYDPEIDGRYIAFTGDSSGDEAVYVWDLKTGTYAAKIGEFDGESQQNPDISGDYVVYEDHSSGNGDIKAWNLRLNSGFIVRGTFQNEINPRIDGNMVVWLNDTTGYVWYRDLDMGGTSDEITSFGFGTDSFDVDNGHILAIVDASDRLVQYTPRAPGEDGVLQDYSFNAEQVNVHGRYVALTADDTTVKLYDILADSTVDFAAYDGTQSYPSVFHGAVAWEDGQGIGAFNVEYRPSVSTARLNSVINVEAEDYAASLYGSRIAFETWDGVDDEDVRLATRSKLYTRTAGSSRYATAAKVSGSYFSAAKNVVLCTGENFPDALAAGPLARALEAPLLLTKKDSLPSETSAEIMRLGATKVYVIGGEPTISATVAAQVDAMTGVSVERIYGADRYETSAKIARRLQTIMGADYVDRAVFTRGDNFPDALSVGPVAAGALAPIFLVRTGSVPSTVASAVNDMNITLGYVIGDTNSVSASTYTAIRNLIIANGAVGTITERWAGPNRYETASAIIENGLAKGWIDLDTLGVAVGTKFPDALGGGAALGYYGSPIILTSGTSLSGATSTFLTNHEFEIGRLDVFGDANSVSDSVYNAIVAKMK